MSANWLNRRRGSHPYFSGVCTFRFLPAEKLNLSQIGNKYEFFLITWGDSKKYVRNFYVFTSMLI
jgi:hypothetical protein